MLTLTGQREIAGCNVYSDDTDLLVRYLMPQTPRIALDDDGKPIFSLIWYRRDVDQLSEEERKTHLGGGLLSLSVELAPDEAQLAEIRKQVASDPNLHAQLERSQHRRLWVDELGRDAEKLAKVVKVDSVPVSGGSVAIAVLAETSGDGGGMGEFVSTLVGVGRVNRVGKQRASFMAKLTQDGAVLLWKLIEKDLGAVRVGYDLEFQHRLTGVRMLVWAEAQKAYKSIQEQWQRLNDDASWSESHSGNSSHYSFGHDESSSAGERLFSTVSGHEISGVRVITEAGAEAVSPETIASLTAMGEDMLKNFLSATFLEFKPGTQNKLAEQPKLTTELAKQNDKEYGHHGITYYQLKDWNESMTASLRHELSTQSVLTSYLAPNGILSGILQGRKIDEFRTQVDFDATFYKHLDVQLLCTADFDADPVELVKAHLIYSGQDRSGPVRVVKDFAFRKNTPPQLFSAYLAQDEHVSYEYELEVFYKGSALTYTAGGRSEETILVLDTDRLGILRVDVQMGLIDWTKIRQVYIELSYGSGDERKETSFTLDGQRQSTAWVEVIGKPVTEAYTYQVTYVDMQGQRLTLPAERGRSKQLVLNQPLQEELEVVLVPAGGIGSTGVLSQVVVALRYQDKEYMVEDTVVLNKEGESKIWKVPLVNKDMRKFQYRVTVFYLDGVVREDSWRTTDNTVLPVGDPFGWRVQILPYLLKTAPGGFSFATIQLTFDDETGIHAERTLEITDFTKPLLWRFRMGDPSRHTYRYTLTAYTSTGEARVLSGEDSKEVLVLTPPRL